MEEGKRMPCILLTLDSEEVRGEAFLPERQVLGNYVRDVFSAATSTENKLLSVSAVNHSFFFLRGNEPLHKEPIAQCTISSISLFPQL